MQSSNRQLTNGGVAYEPSKSEEIQGYPLTFAIPAGPQTPDIKMAAHTSVSNTMNNMQPRPIATGPAPFFIRSNAANALLSRPPFNATRIVNHGNIGSNPVNYTVYLQEGQSLQPAGQSYAAMQAPTHASTPIFYAAQPAVMFGGASFPYPLQSAVPTTATVPAAPSMWQLPHSAAQLPIYAPPNAMAPGIYPAPTAGPPTSGPPLGVLPTVSSAPTTDAAVAGSIGVNIGGGQPTQHTNVQSKPKKILSFIDPATNIDVIQEERKMIKQVTASKHPLPQQTMHGGAVYFDQQQQPPYTAPTSSAAIHNSQYAFQQPPQLQPSVLLPPSSTVTVVPSATHAVTAPALAPLAATKSNASTAGADDGSGATLTSSRDVTPTDTPPMTVAGGQQPLIAATAARPKSSQSPAASKAQPDEEQKNQVYNEFALSIATVAVAASDAVTAAAALPPSYQDDAAARRFKATPPSTAAAKQPPPTTEVVHPAAAAKCDTHDAVTFGFFDDSLHESAPPTPDASPEKSATPAASSETINTTTRQIESVDVAKHISSTTHTKDATSGIVIESTYTASVTTVQQPVLTTEPAKPETLAQAEESVKVALEESSRQVVVSQDEIPTGVDVQDFEALISKKQPDSWFYDNQEGKRVYNRDYMIIVAKMKLARGKPNYMPEANSEIMVSTKHRIIMEILNRESRPQYDMSDSGGGWPTGGSSSMGVNTSSFAPSWQTTAGMQQRRPPYFNRSSTGGGVGGRGSQSGGQRRPMQPPTSQPTPPLIIPRPSLGQTEVQLKRTENAWKPMRSKDKAVDPEQEKNELLYRDVKLILNKITPQTFDELTKDFFALEVRMNTEERVLGVIDILFNKVCDEPNFSELYGRLCEDFRNHQQTQQKQGLQVNPDLRLFSYYLLTKCQLDFEKDKTTEAYKEEMLASIEAAATDEEKARLKDSLDEKLVKYKWRTLGSIRFVGELYKRGLLTQFIAYICMTRLLDRIRLSPEFDEEILECLCKFIATIGRKFESEKPDKGKRVPVDAMRGVFGHCKTFMNDSRLSKRMQFEIQNLLELKDNKWKPRRADAGPKTISEVHSEARLEEMSKQIELDQYQSSRKQPQQAYPAQQQQQQYYGGQQQSQMQQRGGRSQRGSHTNLTSYDTDYGDSGMGGGGHKKQMPVGRSSQHDRDRSGRMGQGSGGVGGRPQLHGASSSTSSTSYETMRTMDPSALSRHTQDTGHIMLAPQRPNWSTGRTVPSTSTSSAAVSTVSNRFNVLTSEDEPRYGGESSAPNSRDSSQNRSASKVAAAADRHAALAAASAMSVSAGGRTASTTAQQATSAVTASAVRFEATSSGSSRDHSLSRPQSTPVDQTMSAAELKKYAVALFEEYVESNDDVEAGKLLQEKTAYIADIVSLILERAIDKHDKERQKFAQLAAKLVIGGVLQTHHLSEGFDKCIATCIETELDTDVPHLWNYLGNMLGAIVATVNTDRPASLRLGDFHSCFQAAGDTGGRKIMGCLLSTVSASEPNGAQLLAELFAGETWSKFGLDDTESVVSFLDQYHLSNLLPSVPTSSAPAGDAARGRHCDNSNAAAAAAEASNGTLADALAAADGGQRHPEIINMERFIKSLEQIKSDKIIKWITDNVASHDTEAFGSALCSALCSKVFAFINTDDDDDLSVFIEQLERLCPIFLRFITGKSNFEKQLLTTLAHCYYQIGCPKDAFPNILECLSTNIVIPRETFLEWWSSEKQKSYGMILKNNQVMTFFQTLKSHHDSPTPSSPTASEQDKA